MTVTKVLYETVWQYAEDAGFWILNAYNHDNRGNCFYVHASSAQQAFAYVVIKPEEYKVETLLMLGHNIYDLYSDLAELRVYSINLMDPESLPNWVEKLTYVKNKLQTMEDNGIKWTDSLGR